LDPLSGYLSLAEQLLNGKKEFTGAWNFGPDSTSFRTVQELQIKMNQHWSEIKKSEIVSEIDQLHEAGLLSVDSSKARKLLQWNPVWNFDQATEKTCLWYKNFIVSNNVISSKQLSEYISDARKNGLKWSE
jgi:CDP-glucose 4,6-dehydratase